MDTKQPEAIRIAEWLEGIRGNTWPSYIPQEAAAELRRQHAEIETLRAGYSAARLEIASLRERVQQLGQLARDVNSRRVMELEAQLEAIGAGGVETLRKRECLHQISEPANAGWCDGCSPDNCGGCASSAVPAQAGEYPELPAPLVLESGYGPGDVPDAYTADQMRAYADATCAARGAAQAAPVDAALIEFIEKCGEVCFQRVREGFKGPMRWDIEFIVPGGDREVRGKTLSDAITKAIAARAAQKGGAA